MPGLNGTGPLGKGSLTGRGLGLCVNGLRQVYEKTSRSAKLMSLVVPAVSAIVMDARKPDGITRRLYYTVRERLTDVCRRRSLSGSRVKSIEEKNSK